MKKSIILLSAIFFAAMLIQSCDLQNNPEENETIPLGQKFIFEVQYHNTAWGYTHEGFYIDDDGSCYSYNIGPEVSYYWTPEDPESLTYDELIFKYHHNKKFIKKIDSDILDKKFQMIRKAAQGPIVEDDIYMADAGNLTYYAYQWNSSGNKYIPVVLAQKGDQPIRNDSHEAAALVEWLNSINTKYQSWFID